MKRIILFLFMAFTATFVMAQSASDIYQEFKDVKHVRAMTVPKMFLHLGSKGVKDSNVQAVIKQIDKVQVLEMDDCSKRKRNKLIKKVEALSQNGYETITQMRDDEEDMKVFGKKSGDKISEIILLVKDDDDCACTFVYGRINPEDLNAVIGMVEDD
jgi:uncharacterized alpha/beta hydrolase family protein